MPVNAAVTDRCTFRDDGSRQRLFGVEVVVESAFGDPNPIDDVAQAGGVVAHVE